MEKISLDYSKFLFVFLLILFTSCSSFRNVNVLVNSYADSSNSIYTKTYFLEKSSNYRDLNYSSLEEQSFATQIDSILSYNGYRKVFDKKYANYIIKWNTIVQGPFKKEDIVTRLEQPSMPVYYPYYYKDKNGKRYRNREVAYYTNPTYSNHLVISQYFIKQLIIKAFYKNDKTAWELTTVTESSNTILRNSFPYLIEASKNFIEKDTQQAITIKIPENFQEK